MPHAVITNPDMDLDRSLGWLASAWIEFLCLRGNGDVLGQPVTLTDEYSEFIVMCYALDELGYRCHDHAFLSRPKGLAKSELAAYVGLFDALGPSRFDHWAKPGEVYVCPFGTGFTYEFQPGEPVGKRIVTPMVQCIATEAGQAGEIYSTIHYNCKEGPLSVAFPHKDDVGLTRINVPGGGWIKPLTASGDSKDGGKATLVLFDETHLYKTPELHNAYSTLSRNLVKRRGSAGTWCLETSTMFAQGEDSVAEQTYGLIQDIKSKKYKGRIRQLFDHRYSDITPEELDDPERVREALIEAYAEGLGWNDLESMVDQIMDPRADITASFRYWFNSPFTVESAWIAPWSWNGCGPAGWGDDFPKPKEIRRGDQIVLGFDGSRGRQRGVADATALIACRISDGFMFPIEIWEQPMNYHKDEPWQVPIAEVDAAVRKVFKNYKVIAFFCDPAYWTPTIADWEARYGDKLPVKASTAHPLEFWVGGSGNAKRTVDMLAKFEDAVLDREIQHAGDLVDYGETLNQHIYNARRAEVTQGITIRKETANSPKKIDAAMAAAICWAARLAAVAAGYGTKPKPRIAVKLR